MRELVKKVFWRDWACSSCWTELCSVRDSQFPRSNTSLWHTNHCRSLLCLSFCVEKDFGTWDKLTLLQGFAPPVLVFVQSIERAKELFHELIYEGINVDVIHADKTQQQVGGFYFCSRNALERKVKARVWLQVTLAANSCGFLFRGLVLFLNIMTTLRKQVHLLSQIVFLGCFQVSFLFFS